LSVFELVVQNVGDLWWAQ